MTSLLSPQWMLLAGILLSPLARHSERLPKQASLWSTRLLQTSVVILGASLPSQAVFRHGFRGILLTFVSILCVLLLGYLLGKLLQIRPTQQALITIGTAICGGSAIAATAPLLAAGALDLTISISIVFLFNSLALFLLPWLGHILELSQTQFGVWTALAVHDTSSVVATATVYGSEALAAATTIKLTRTLWLVPLVLVISARLSQQQTKRVSLPPFLLAFLVALVIFNFFEALHPLRPWLQSTAKLGFSITLFLVGLAFDLKRFKSLGIRPLIFALILWLLTLGISLVLSGF
jgi:uncharacterized integral membrane protein (TIGR00698 family)